MKKHLLAVAVTALAAGSVFAQANDTLAKIKASGSVTLGVRCLLYTSPSPRDLSTSRMPSSA